MKVTGSPGIYAVVGSPIAHSLSPRIHQEFASQLNIDYRYGMLEPSVEKFEETVRGFFATGGNGLNITLPFKRQALEISDLPSAGAKLAGAANTIFFGSDGNIVSCNTDGAGLFKYLVKRLGWQLTDQNILVLGAGGVANGVMEVLISQKPKQVTIANRTVARAEELINRFEGCADEVGVSLTASNLDKLPKDCKFIFNASSAGHAGKAVISVADLQSAEYACDLSYGDAAKPFLAAANAAGIKYLADGLGMLIEQAAFSCAFWHQRMPDTTKLYEELAEFATVIND